MIERHASSSTPICDGLLAELDRRLAMRGRGVDPDTGRADEMMRAVSEAASRDLCRRDLLAFTERVTPGYLAGWVHRDLADRLRRFSAQVARGESPRLVVTLPPRHGKSRLISELLTTWHLGRHPTHDVVVAGYSLDIARDRTREARAVAMSDEAREVFGSALDLAEDTSAKAYWRLKAGGGLTAVGVGGPLTGRGAHLLVIDDPVKSAAEALSPTYRQRVWDWYRSVARTRLAPGGGIILVMTRWHEDDLAGRLIAASAEDEHADAWEVVDYPAIATHDEPHRQKGEALHPARYPLAELEAIRADLGTYWWTALYQGRPTTPAGQAWERSWWKRHVRSRALTADEIGAGWRATPKRFDTIKITGDLTFGGQGETASWVSLQVWGILAGDAYLLEEKRGRWTYPVARAHLASLRTRWLAKRLGRLVIKLEYAAHAIALAQEMQDEWRELEVERPRGSKLARALAGAPVIEAGRAFLPLPDEVDEGELDVEDWINEVTSFGAGAKNDDRVDAAGLVLRDLNTPKRGARPYFSALGARGA